MRHDNLSNGVQTKTTGVDGANLVPGSYIRTRTGVVRGEELFSRPDLPRPWRTPATQKELARITLKEKEIEELMRICSNLRTELGNARSDARFLEYALTEKMKAEAAEKNRLVESLNAQIDQLKEEQTEITEKTEHQIRLLKSQNENEVMSFKKEAQLSTEQCAEMAKAYQKQIEDIKAAGTREVQFVESRFVSRVEELTAELRAARELARSAEQHYLEQTTASNITHQRIEADYKERFRASEQRLDDLRKIHEADLANERTAKEAALEEVRRGREKLAAALVDKDEVVQRFKLWNNYILTGVDKFYITFIENFPELATNPGDSKLRQLPSIYAPRAALEDPEAKATMESIIYRLQQLDLMKNFDSLGMKAPSAYREQAAVDAGMTAARERQDRLRAAVSEIADKVAEVDASMSGMLSRLYFFSDNLEDAIAHAPHHIRPPLRNVVFACLFITNGEVLWMSDADAMRFAVTLYYNTMRLKMAEYGGYECYSDAALVLLAFEDAAGACRFCAECQEWLLRLPWPDALTKNPLCKKEWGTEQNVLFNGLRVSMAIHAGECFIEDSALPSVEAGSRAHYYGRAVSQIVHMSALAQGGQIIVSKPAWSICLQRRGELRSLVACDLGAFEIFSLNPTTGLQEQHSIELLQISSNALKRRVFKSPPLLLEPPTASSLAGVKSYILAGNIETLEQRRHAINEALRLVKEEFHSVGEELRVLMEQARHGKPHFHLLPLPEMVSQMNDMYTVMEKVAVHTEEMRADLIHMASVQEELYAQGKELREYFKQHALHSASEDKLNIEIEAISHRMETMLADAKRKHRREVEVLQQALHERDQRVWNLNQQIGILNPPIAPH